MKKNLACFLSIALCLAAFTACNDEAEETPAAENTAAPTEPTPPSEPTGDDNGTEEAEEETTTKQPAPTATPEADGKNAAEATTTGGAKDQPQEKQPSAEEARAATVKKAQADREQRIKSIYTLIRKGDEESIQELVKIAQSDEQLGIRATAVRVLGQKKREDLIPLFKNFVEKDETMVQLEAAIVLYKWGEHKTALPILEKYSERGVALRRAFMTGRKDGKGLYDKNAKKFLKKGLGSTNVLTQLDAAVGLYELGDEKKSLKVFKNVMEGDHPHHVRIAALNYLRHLKADDKVRAIIQIATGDTNERVKQRANDILVPKAGK